RVRTRSGVLPALAPLLQEGDRKEDEKGEDQEDGCRHNRSLAKKDKAENGHHEAGSAVEARPLREHGEVGPPLGPGGSGPGWAGGGRAGGGLGGLGHAGPASLLRVPAHDGPTLSGGRGPVNL